MVTLKVVGEQYELLTEVPKDKSIYLDHWAIRHFSKASNSEDRKVFLTYLQNGGTLLVSWGHVIELSKQGKGNSLDEIKSFFTEIDNHWAPIRMWPQEVIDLERKYQKGMNLPCYDDVFMESLKKEFAAEIRKVTCLGSVIEALEKVPDEVEALKIKWEENANDLLQIINDAKKNYSKRAYERNLRTTENTWNGILNYLCTNNDGKKLNTNDIQDMLHGIVPSAYCRYLLLDGHWAEHFEND